VEYYAAVRAVEAVMAKPMQERCWISKMCVKAANIAPMALVYALAFGMGLTPSARAQEYKETFLYSFTGGADGNAPVGVILGGNGTLYGTTEIGGDLSCFAPLGCGTVFEVEKTGAVSVLHTFTGQPDGAFPTADLVMDSSGNLYGTTSEGGDTPCVGTGYGCGSVFELNPSGAETQLYSFNGPPDGVYPEGPVLDAEGNLYGVTIDGGTGLCHASDGVVFGCGTVYQLVGGQYTSLYSLEGGARGKTPGALVRGPEGTLYGTAVVGGKGDCYIDAGCGVIFELNPSGQGTVLYSFTGGADGGLPTGLILGPGDTLYGVTEEGGNLECNTGNGDPGCGTVFKLTASGETVLYAFNGGTDGAFPDGSLVLDEAGNLYGTTAYGGDPTCQAPSGCGTVFELDSTGQETVLYSFKGPPDGVTPGGLVRDALGNLYGATILGGASGAGVVFKLVP
jgi:uncharacterized repeat protein (TIGR03803 family)